MKRKFLLPILSVCMVVALVSVGFAAWLITGNDTTGATGNFVTYDVSNNYFTVTATPANGTENDIVFGQSGTFENAWLTAEGVDPEKLTATFTITITPDVPFAAASEGIDERNVASVLGSNNKVKITLDGKSEAETPDTTTQEKFATALQNNYLAQPTMSCTYGATGSETTIGSGDTTWATGVVIELPAAAFTIAEDYKTATATVTVKFAWGSAFTPAGENQVPVNPYTYFNGLENIKANRDTATTALDALNALNDATYYLHLAVAAPANA